MPTVRIILDCATNVLWFGDVDAGEMLLNYPLDRAISPFAGVYFSWIEGREDTKVESGGRKW